MGAIGRRAKEGADGLAVAMLAAPVIAIAVDDLAEQGHLAHALVHQAADLVDDFVERPAAFHAAAEGDDAEGASVAAAVDDRHVGGHGCLAAERQVFDRLHRAGGLHRVLHLEAAQELFAFDGGHLGVDLRLAQVIDQGRRFAGRHEHIDKGIAIEQLLAGLDADHAAHERDSAVRFGAFPGFEAAQLAGCLVFGALADDTRVEHDHVGVVELVGGAVADLFKLGGHVVGIGHVHLAADGPNVVFACGVGSLVGGEFVRVGFVCVAGLAVLRAHLCGNGQGVLLLTGVGRAGSLETVYRFTDCTRGLTWCQKTHGQGRVSVTGRC